MRFGLKNTPGTIQRLMHIVLAKVKWQFDLVYLDDIILFLRTPDEHNENVRQVMTLLNDAGVTLNLNKCKFFANFIDYVGHVLNPGHLEVVTRTIYAVLRFEHPTNLTEFRSFLGLCNGIPRIVSSFAYIAAPLNEKIR